MCLKSGELPGITESCSASFTYMKIDGLKSLNILIDMLFQCYTKPKELNFMDKIQEDILRRRMHGLYLSRKCKSLTQLSHELLGLHCWFHRNVAFSALIRGADLHNWKTRLTKTWLYRGTLHGVCYEDLPTLLALHGDKRLWGCSSEGGWLADDIYGEIAARAVSLMEDGVYSRAEMRQIFAGDYDENIIQNAFSPWGGVFCELARHGRVAFRSMTSRDFDLIDAQPTQTASQVLPRLFRSFISAYGPATLDDAAWFFGLDRERTKELSQLNLEEYSRLEFEKDVYYYIDTPGIGDIPELTLLSGFDPLVVSYVRRDAILPKEYKSRVILKSGICLPTIAINGKIAGLWNIKKKSPTLEFFQPQPKRLQQAALDMICQIQWQTNGQI